MIAVAISASWGKRAGTHINELTTAAPQTRTARQNQPARGLSMTAAGTLVSRDNAERLSGRLTSITPTIEPTTAPIGPRNHVSVTAAAIVTKPSSNVVMEIQRS